jgi:hypothetical protein
MPRYVPVVCVSEIAAIQRADLIDPIGGEFDGKWYAEPKSLAAYRKLQECPCVVTG